MLFLFFFLVTFSNFLTIPVVREKNKVKRALAIPTDAPTILVNKIFDTPSLVALNPYYPNFEFFYKNLRVGVFLSLNNYFTFKN